MKIKTYIALFLTFIFLAKFFAVDANGLSALFSGDKVTFVKQGCLKKNIISSKSDTANIKINTPLDISVYKIIGYCTSTFLIEGFTWNSTSERILAKPNHSYSPISKTWFFAFPLRPPRYS